MIFDVCAYLGFWPYWSVQETTAEGLVELMDNFGVDRAAICSLRSIFYDHEEGNREVVEATKKFPDRFVGVATVYPYQEGALEELDRCVSKFNMRGIELQPNYHGYKLRSPVVKETLELAVKADVPVITPLRLSMNWNLPSVDILEVSRLVESYSDVKFIVGCFNYGEIEELMGLMRRCENLLAETSGLHLMRGVEKVVSEVGADRVLFGSGMPIQSVGPALAKIREADIDEEDKRLILGENAVRVLGLNK